MPARSALSRTRCRRRSGPGCAPRMLAVIRDGIYPGLSAAARFPAERISAARPRRRRPRPHARRRPALPPPGPAEHDAAADRRRGPRDRPARGRPQPRRDGGDPAPASASPARLRQFLEHLRTDPRFAAAEPRLDARGLLCDRPPRRPADRRAVLDPAARPARDPRGRGIPRAQRLDRLLSERHAGRLAARRLLLQCL